jgi:hypothetical protein
MSIVDANGFNARESMVCTTDDTCTGCQVPEIDTHTHTHTHT